MSVPDEPAADAISEMTGLPVVVQAGDGRATRRAGRAGAGRVPLTVTAKVMQWAKLSFPTEELAWSGYDELSVRLAAGWPERASQSKLNLDDVTDELLQARQALAERAGRHRGKDHGDGPTSQADAAWVQQWADRLARAGWMPIGDQSMQAVRYAIERALIDCDQVRKLVVTASADVVEAGILKIIT